MRRAINMALLCHFRVKTNDIENHYGVEFPHYFQQELDALQPLAEDGLVEINQHQIVVTPMGRFLVRRICMVFDAHYRYNPPSSSNYSRII